MPDFGWSYPAGCESVPDDENSDGTVVVNCESGGFTDTLERGAVPATAEGIANLLCLPSRWADICSEQYLDTDDYGSGRMGGDECLLARLSHCAVGVAKRNAIRRGGRQCRSISGANGSIWNLRNRHTSGFLKALRAANTARALSIFGHSKGEFMLKPALVAALLMLSTKQSEAEMATYLPIVKASADNSISTLEM